MKAEQIRMYGGSDVLEINEKASIPEVSTGKILVEVHAAGVNPMDWKIREGYLKQTTPLQLPVTLGGDFSGVIIEIGEGVTGYEKGDEVFGHTNILKGESGSFAEFVSVDAKETGLKPTNINHVKAACLPLSAVSAWQAIVENIGAKRGQKILIHGGVGGIGSMAIQIAKHFGAYVATTVRGDDIPFAKALGADEIIDYKKQPFEDVLHDFDAILDTIGGETYLKSFIVMKREGMIVSLLEQPQIEKIKHHGVKTVFQSTQVTTERLLIIKKLVEDGVIKIPVDRMFPLEEADEALEYLKNGHPRGKVAVVVK